VASLVYDILGIATTGAGVYFLWRGLGSLESADYLTGLVGVLVGLFVLRAGLELLKVGAAARVAARAEAAEEVSDRKGRGPAAAAPGQHPGPGKAASGARQ